jgi:hemolysin activation/secretion protein
VTLNAARIQKAWGLSTVLGRLSAQYSPSRLLPSEQAILGGFGTVRGHEPSAFLGDSGYTLTAEFMLPPPYLAEKTLFNKRIAELVQLALFVDHGGVWNTRAKGGEKPFQALTGLGGGIRLFYGDRFSFRYDVGIPIDPQPGSPNIINYFTGQLSFF